MVDRWRDHQAIILGTELCNDILHFHGSESNAATVGRAARPYLDCVIRAGGDGRSSLIEMGALQFFWMERREGCPEQKVQERAYATRFLLQIPGAIKNQHTWKPKVIAALGYKISENLRPLLVQMWAVHRDAGLKRAERHKVLSSFGTAQV